MNRALREIERIERVAKKGSEIAERVREGRACVRCLKPIPRDAIECGGRRYCGGHCLAIDQVRRSEQRLRTTREVIGGPIPSPAEVGAKWGRGE